MEKAQPLITLGVSCYNAEETIANALDSAIAQKWENKEIIVVDDCSSDSSWKILSDYNQRYPHLIRIFKHQTNSGIAAVRNTLIKEAQGSYIAFFDDDDIGHPSRISKQYRALAKVGKEKLALCHTARKQISPEGSFCYIPTFATKKIVSGEQVALRILTGRPLFNEYGGAATCSQMGAKETYTKLGGFDSTIWKGEDTEFNIRLSLAGGSFIGIAEPLVTQTMTPTSDKKASLERKFCNLIWQKHKSFLEKNDCYEFCLQWLNLKFDFISNDKKAFAKNFLSLSFRHPLKVLQRAWWSLPNLRHNFGHRTQRLSL